MAYTYNKDKRCPLQCEPGVLSIRIPNSAAEVNIPVYVPWKDVELMYAYTVCTTSIDATGHMEIDLEVNASGGTEIGTAQVAASSSPGDIDEFTITAGTRLDYADAGIDAINVEVDGSSTGTGAVQLYLYFEKVDRDG